MVSFILMLSPSMAGIFPWESGKRDRYMDVATFFRGTTVRSVSGISSALALRFGLDLWARPNHPPNLPFTHNDTKNARARVTLVTCQYSVQLVKSDRSRLITLDSLRN